MLIAGLLTLHEADNYGAVLQAYALQQTLSELGMDSRFVSFTNNTHGKDESKMRQMPPMLKKIRSEGEKRAALFKSFRMKYLKTADPISFDQASKLNDAYDVFITGSDQVWNMSIPGVDLRYLLPFAEPAKRFSYAASFGSAEVPDASREYYTRYLSSFQGISVREKSGMKLVKELCGRESVHCCDPIFLPRRKAWDKIAASYDGPPYYLLFMVEYDKDLVALAKEISVSTGIDLKIVTAFFAPQCGFEAYSDTSPAQWVGLIKDARGIFTNSFHGCAMSLIYEKPLCAFQLKNRLESRNSRIEELLQMAGAVENHEDKWLFGGDSG